MPAPRHAKNGPPPSVGHLIARYTRYNPDTLEDLFAILAANVEDAFLLAGATPGTDYTRRDCFTLAAPFVLAMFQNTTRDISFALEWPTLVDQQKHTSRPLP